MGLHPVHLDQLCSPGNPWGWSADPKIVTWWPRPCQLSNAMNGPQEHCLLSMSLMNLGLCGSPVRTSPSHSAVEAAHPLTPHHWRLTLTLAPGPWLSPHQVFPAPCLPAPSPTFPFLTCHVSNDVLLPSTPPTQCHGHTWSLSPAWMAPPWRVPSRQASSVATASYFSRSIT